MLKFLKMYDDDSNGGAGTSTDDGKNTDTATTNDNSQETNDTTATKETTTNDTETTKKVYDEMKRKIAKEMGMNIFDAEVQETVKTALSKQKELEELNKTELQKAQELVNAANEKETALNEKITALETITKLQGKNVNKDFQEDIIDLLKARGLEASDENIDKIIAKNPSWVNEKKEFTQMGANQATVKKEATTQDKAILNAIKGGRR